MHENAYIDTNYETETVGIFSANINGVRITERRPRHISQRALTVLPTVRECSLYQDKPYLEENADNIIIDCTEGETVSLRPNHT